MIDERLVKMFSTEATFSGTHFRKLESDLPAGNIRKLDPTESD
jgi:hypothetical protein